MLPLKQIWATVGVVATILLCLGLGAVGYFSTQIICQSIEQLYECTPNTGSRPLPPAPKLISDESFVLDIRGVKEFVGARGQYVTTFEVPNAEYKAWVESNKTLEMQSPSSVSMKRVWEQIINLYLGGVKTLKGDNVRVHLEGEVLMAFNLDKLEAGKTVVVEGKHVTVTLDGPYVMTTHIYESRRAEVEEQALWLSIWNNKDVQEEARKQQDAELVKYACSKDAKTSDDKYVGSIQQVAKDQATTFLKTFLKALHPDYVVDVNFQNESCSVDTIFK